MFPLDEIFIPTEVKFAFKIEADGFSMDDDDFNVVVKGSTGSVTLEKDDCFDDGEGHWYFAFDSSDVGPGQPVATVTAYVPDTDYPDGLRTEAYKMKLPVYIRI